MQMWPQKSLQSREHHWKRLFSDDMIADYPGNWAKYWLKLPALSSASLLHSLINPSPGIIITSLDDRDAKVKRIEIII